MQSDIIDLTCESHSEKPMDRELKCEDINNESNNDIDREINLEVFKNDVEKFMEEINEMEKKESKESMDKFKKEIVNAIKPSKNANKYKNTFKNVNHKYNQKHSHKKYIKLSNKVLSQHYTSNAAWDHLADQFKATVPNWNKFTIIDPCAGSGYLIKNHFSDEDIKGYSFDMHPTSSNVTCCDMGDIDYSKFGKCVVITNMPFNVSAKPIEKLNYIAAFSEVKYIAVVNAEKYEYYNTEVYDMKNEQPFNRRFHLIHSEIVEGIDFTPPVTISITFQIWERRDTLRSKCNIIITELDKFVKIDYPSKLRDAHFYIKYPLKKTVNTSFYRDDLITTKYDYKAGKSLVAVKIIGYNSLDKKKYIYQLLECMINMRKYHDDTFRNIHPTHFAPGIFIKYLLTREE